MTNTIFKNLPDHKWTIDLSQLESMIDFAGGRGETDLLRAVMGAYIGAGPQLVIAMKRALAENDLTRIAHIAHRLKSSSANVGAMQFSDLCKEIEDQARNGVLDHSESLAARFEELYYEAHRELEKLIGLFQAPIRVLMVEDDITLEPIWKSLLDRLFPGNQLDWVISSSEAWSKIEHATKTGQPYDLIVADVFLAGAQTGLDLFDQIRADEKKSHQLVLVTGVDRTKLLEFLSDYKKPPRVISKPLNPIECETVLKQLLTPLERIA